MLVDSARAHFSSLRIRALRSTSSTLCREASALRGLAWSVAVVIGPPERSGGASSASMSILMARMSPDSSAASISNCAWEIAAFKLASTNALSSSSSSGELSTVAAASLPLSPPAPCTPRRTAGLGGRRVGKPPRMHDGRLTGQWTMTTAVVSSAHRLTWRGGCRCNPRTSHCGEHLLPQKWQRNWHVEDVQAQLDRAEHVHRLGNLTLLTESLNLSVSNGPWLGENGKWAKLEKYDVLLMNREIRRISKDGWDEQRIDDRTLAILFLSP